MRHLRKGLWFALLAGLGASAAVQAADYQSQPQVQAFIQDMANNHGFAPEQLHSLFTEVERKQSILDAISRPAERAKPWKDYRKIFITDQRIQRGVDFWKQHAATLARAEQTYGVPAEVIVSIIGVETFYGRITGNFRVIDALSTLGFDYPPRADFFKKELREFLLLSRDQQVNPLTLKGSYAGAMGMPQFMPSSYRAYAVDFDNDGHINIWNNPVDAIGSVANYFKVHGWVTNGAVVSRASVNGSRVDEGLTQGLDPVKNVAELAELGWQSQDSLPADLPITAFRLEGAEGNEYWMGQKNFYVITRYNRSVMYAMAVHQLAGEIRRARGAN